MAQSGIATGLGWRGDNPETLPLFTGNLEDYQRDVLAQNLEITPDATRLADMVNSANTQQLLKMMENLLPGYGQLIKQGIQNAAALMRGEIPEDVKRQIQDYSAERNIAGGVSGSQFGQFGELRSFGLTSLEAQRAGQGQFLQLTQGTPRPQQFDFTSMFLTPGQKAQFELQKYQVNLPVQQFNNWVRSLPTNLERMGAQALDYIATFATSAAGVGMGGIGGAGGAGSSGGGAGAVSQPVYNLNPSPGGAGYAPEFYQWGPQ